MKELDPTAPDPTAGALASLRNWCALFQTFCAASRPATIADPDDFARRAQAELARVEQRELARLLRAWSQRAVGRALRASGRSHLFDPFPFVGVGGRDELAPALSLALRLRRAVTGRARATACVARTLRARRRKGTRGTRGSEAVWLARRAARFAWVLEASPESELALALARYAASDFAGAEHHFARLAGRPRSARFAELVRRGLAAARAAIGAPAPAAASISAAESPSRSELAPGLGSGEVSARRSVL